MKNTEYQIPDTRKPRGVPLHRGWRKTACSVLFCLLCPVLATAQNDTTGFKVIAYAASWNELDVDSIRFSLLTHINYAFLIPEADGRLEPVKNPDLLREMVKKAHENDVKVFIAVGGWNLGDGGGNDLRFETLAADELSRERFIREVIHFVETYELDGVDIDWEYPDAPMDAGQAKPSSEYFYELMLDLRVAVDQLEKELSIAVVNKGDRIGAGIPSRVFDVVDWVNIMAYDYSGEAHHSSYELASACLDYWIEQRGLPREKAVLGLPFYGKYPHTPYKELLQADSAAGMKNEVNGILYNGREMIRAKTRLAKKRASGVMFWELSQDVYDPEHSLLQAIYNEAHLIPQ